MKSYSGLGPTGGRQPGKVSSDLDDTAGTIQSRQNSRDDLKRVENALRRLDTGSFGHCLYCGGQISMTRLNVDPAVESCAVCAED